MFKHRDELIKELDLDAVETVNKYIQKQKQQEKKEKVHKSINKDFDLRDNFLGIKQLKKNHINLYQMSSKTKTAPE